MLFVKYRLLVSEKAPISESNPAENIPTDYLPEDLLAIAAEQLSELEGEIDLSETPEQFVEAEKNRQLSELINGDEERFDNSYRHAALLAENRLKDVMGNMSQTHYMEYGTYLSKQRAAQRPPMQVKQL
jgi:hypothetical protein